MQTLDFKVTERKTLGKKSNNALRKEGLVPAVLYGGEKNIHFQILAKSMKKLTDTPNTYLVNLDIDGTVYNAFLQASQYHPVSDEALHFDFIQISDEKPIKISLPVKVEGFSVGVKAGGILIVEKRYVKVLALAKNLPNEIAIDVTDLKIGQSIKISDLKIENLELTEESSESVIAVKLTRTATVLDDEDEDEEATTETEAEAKPE